MGLEERLNRAPLPVKVAVKTAGTIAYPFVWIGQEVAVQALSLLPRRYSARLLGSKTALSYTKKTSLLEAGVAAADWSYRLFTGDHFLPADLSYYLLLDGAWRFQRASEGFQQFYSFAKNTAQSELCEDSQMNWQ